MRRDGTMSGLKRSRSENHGGSFRLALFLNGEASLVAKEGLAALHIHREPYSHISGTT
jgi:hypothetical protein